LPKGTITPDAYKADIKTVCLESDYQFSAALFKVPSVVRIQTNLQELSRRELYFDHMGQNGQIVPFERYTDESMYFEPRHLRYYPAPSNELNYITIKIVDVNSDSIFPIYNYKNPQTSEIEFHFIPPFRPFEEEEEIEYFPITYTQYLEEKAKHDAKKGLAYESRGRQFRQLMDDYGEYLEANESFENSEQGDDVDIYAMTKAAGFNILPMSSTASRKAGFGN